MKGHEVLEMGNFKSGPSFRRSKFFPLKADPPLKGEARRGWGGSRFASSDSSYVQRV